MDNTVNFYGFAADDVECKIGFYNKDAIACIFEFVILWQPAKKWMNCKTADVLIEFINKSCSTSRTVICDPVEDQNKVVNGNRKIMKGVSI